MDSRLAKRSSLEWSPGPVSLSSTPEAGVWTTTPEAQVFAFPLAFLLSMAYRKVDTPCPFECAAFGRLRSLVYVYTSGTWRPEKLPCVIDVHMVST